jgi:hypothetical protein
MKRIAISDAITIRLQNICLAMIVSFQLSSNSIVKPIAHIGIP